MFFPTKFEATVNALKKIQSSLLDPCVCVCMCVHGCVGWGVITASCWLRCSPVCSVGHLWVAWWALWNGALLVELNRHSHELYQTPWAQVALSLWGFVHTHTCRLATTLKTQNDPRTQTYSTDSYKQVDIRNICSPWKCFNGRPVTLMFSQSCPNWPKLRQLWMSCPAAASIFGLYWPTSTCLIRPNHTSAHHPFISFVCGLHCSWEPLRSSQNPSFIPNV